jgi:hypothetical protein
MAAEAILINRVSVDQSFEALMIKVTAETVKRSKEGDLLFMVGPK